MKRFFRFLFRLLLFAAAFILLVVQVGELSTRVHRLESWPTRGGPSDIIGTTRTPTTP